MTRRICFEDPSPDAQAGLDSGKYRRVDGVIREVSSGRLVEYLRECSCDEPGNSGSNDDNNSLTYIESVPADLTKHLGSGLELSSGVVLAGLALVGLTIGAVATVGASRRKKESRRELEWRIAEARRDSAQVAVTSHRVAAPAGWYDDGSGQLRWWDGYEWTEHYHTASPRVAAPAGWYDDGSGRQRWWDGQDWTEHYQGSQVRNERPQDWVAALDGTHSSDLEPSHELPRISLNRAQWEEQVRIMLQERTISELRWRLLSNARIEDADGELLQWQSRLRSVTAQEFSLSIDRYVASQPAQAFELAMAGWYDDGSGRQRWWDGLEWTDYFQLDESRMLLPGQ